MHSGTDGAGVYLEEVLAWEDTHARRDDTVEACTHETHATHDAILDAKNDQVELQASKWV